MLTDTTESKYKVGQVWKYNTRSCEEESTLTIVKIESDSKLGTIVHISLQGLHVKNLAIQRGYSDTISHMPFTEEAIQKSVTELLQENVELPDYQKGYKQWRAAIEHGRAGIFTITVAEGVDFVESALKR